MKALDKKHNILLYSMETEEFEWHQGASRREGQGEKIERKPK